MKNKMLDAHKNMPPFLEADALNQLRNQHRNVYVTESLDTEVVDIIVDKSEGSIKIRVDGKGRGPDWKFWKDHFESNTGSDYLRKTCPIEKCIIRCSTSRNPLFLKVLGVVSIDTVSYKQKWVPFNMIKRFCESTNMSPMPIVYSGLMSFDHIKGLVDKPILGVKRDGILVAPDSTPTVYIKIPVNVDSAVFTPEKSYDERAMSSLAAEFANRAFDEGLFKKEVKREEQVKPFVFDKVRKASEDLLLMAYVQRAEEEAGIDAQKAGERLRIAVMDRGKTLWKRYA